jgi:hypothetical protein
MTPMRNIENSGRFPQIKTLDLVELSYLSTDKVKQVFLLNPLISFNSYIFALPEQKMD